METRGNFAYKFVFFYDVILQGTLCFFTVFSEPSGKEKFWYKIQKYHQPNASDTTEEVRTKSRERSPAFRSLVWLQKENTNITLVTEGCRRPAPPTTVVGGRGRGPRVHTGVTVKHGGCGSGLRPQGTSHLSPHDIPGPRGRESRPETQPVSSRPTHL